MAGFNLYGDPEVSLFDSAAPVPEPRAAMLALGALGTLVSIRRIRSRASKQERLQ